MPSVKSLGMAALFAGAASAQSSAMILNLFEYGTTLTYLAAASNTTTYTHVCPQTTKLASGASSIARTSNLITPTPTPTATDSGIVLPSPTARALLRREDEDLYCEAYTLIQGPETWGFHLTDKDAMTIDGGCSWKGGLEASATLTCVITTDGPAMPGQTSGVISSSIEPSDLSSLSVIQLMTVVGAPTSTGAKSTGIAPGRALPTGVMGVVGGAVGIVAALAL